MAAEPEKGADPAPSARRRGLLWAVVGIVLLAVVIYGVAAVSSPRDSEPGEQATSSVSAQDPSDAEPSAAELLRQSESARSSGDTTRALELARLAAESDPDNAAAKQLVLTLTNETAGGQSTSTASATTTGTSAPDGTSAAPVVQPRVKDLKTLLPAKIAGYSMGIVQALGKDAVVTAEPAPGSSASKSITRVSFSVHDRGSEKAASQWVAAINKRVYPKSRASLAIVGSPALFGTDGRRLAAVTFSRGPYSFESVVVVKSGNPASAKAQAVQMAEAFPFKR